MTQSTTAISHARHTAKGDLARVATPLIRHPHDKLLAASILHARLERNRLAAPREPQSRDVSSRLRGARSTIRLRRRQSSQQLLPTPAFIDHVSIPVADFDKSAAFYDAMLATLGMERRKQNPIGIDWGPPETAPPIFWIVAQKPGYARAGLGLHISFRAKDRAEVHAFYKLP